jgi:hypothetical protein
VAGVILINPSLVRPEDFEPGFGPPLAVIVAELDQTQDRGRWAAVLERVEGDFTIVPGATRAYQRNLPLVGKAAASLVGKAGK